MCAFLAWLLLDVSDERERWTFLLGHVEIEGRLITRIYALDGRTRTIRWSFDTADTFEVRPWVVGRTLVVPAGREGQIVGLERSSGREIWRMRVEPYRAMHPLNERSFVLCGRNSRVSLWRREGGRSRKVWEHDTSIQPREAWLSGGRLIVPTYQSVLCLDPASGKELWNFAPEEAECIYARPMGERIVAWDWWRREIFALDPESGRLLWKRSASASPCVLGAAGPTLLVSFPGGGRIEALDARTGKDRWSLEGLDLHRALPPTDDLAYHPFLQVPVDGSSLYGVSSGRKVVVASTEEGRLQDEWPVGDAVVGLSTLKEGFLAATPTRWIFFSKSGERRGAIAAPDRLHYLRGVK
jgi:hypothetical protein